MKENLESLGKLAELIDSIENLTYSLNIPMPADFHVVQMKKVLPEKIEELKSVFTEISGENPWR